MRPPAIQQMLRRSRVLWEGACKITGVGACPEATHRLYVTEDGDLAFYHGPEGDAPAWTCYVSVPHPPGAVLARWEPPDYEFIFRFDRDWDPMVATCSVAGMMDSRLWTALRGHLVPPTREQSALWQSRFYCRAILREGASAPAGEPAPAENGTELTRFVRVFARDDRLALSFCSAGAEAEISLCGAVTVAIPYAALAETRTHGHRRRWVFHPAIDVCGRAVNELEIETPEVEEGEWAAIDELIDERAGTRTAEPGSRRLVAGTYALRGIADGRRLTETTDQARILLGEEALILLEPETGGAIATVPYESIRACAIERHATDEDFLLVAPGAALCVRQAGLEVRRAASCGTGLTLFRQRFTPPASTVMVESLAGVLHKPEEIPAVLCLDADALRAEWGVGTAALPLAEMSTRRIEREQGRLRLVVGAPGREWDALGAPETLLPLAQALDEAVLPRELELERLSELYRRWQRRRAETLVWGMLSDLSWLDHRLRSLMGEDEPEGENGGRLCQDACDLLMLAMDNLKAQLDLVALSLPHAVAWEEGSFLRHLGEPAAPVLERSCRYVERVAKSILRSLLPHLHRSLEEIEKNLRARDDQRPLPQPGKLTLGFEAAHSVYLAHALGGAVLGPLATVAGVALAGLKHSRETHSHNEHRESLSREYAVNALTWWRHLNLRVRPLLVREIEEECSRLSRSLVQRDRQIYEQMLRRWPATADRRFRRALIAMLLEHARFRWSRIDAAETITVGELLDELTVTVPSSLPTPGPLPPMVDRQLPRPAGTAPGRPAGNGDSGSSRDAMPDGTAPAAG
jgi:hypothetical protein